MNNKNTRCIVLTGGGTAGHCMPGLYLLPDLRRHFDHIHYIGSSGIERRIVTEYGIDYSTIDVCKLDRAKKWSNIKIPYTLIRSISQAKKALREVDADIVFSKGGYVALPVCIAAHRLGIPVISHESDYSMGLANKIIMHHCDIMCVNYDNIKGKKIVYSGPIMPETFLSNTEKLCLKELPTILVTGGSQGALAINEWVYSHRDKLMKKYNVIHIVGNAHISAYHSIDNYNVMAYSDNMSSLYDIADVVICRAGAGTIFECINARLPMILIPLESRSSRGDQIQNAEYFERKGICRILHQSSLNVTDAADYVDKYCNDIDMYMAQLSSMHIPNGRQIVMNNILKLL